MGCGPVWLPQTKLTHALCKHVFVASTLLQCKVVCCRSVFISYLRSHLQCVEVPLSTHSEPAPVHWRSTHSELAPVHWRSTHSEPAPVHWRSTHSEPAPVHWRSTHSELAPVHWHSTHSELAPAVLVPVPVWYV